MSVVNEMQQEIDSRKPEELIVKEADFLGFQKIKTDKNHWKLQKGYQIQQPPTLKAKQNWIQRETIVELKTKNESLKKEVLFFKKAKTPPYWPVKLFLLLKRKKYLDTVEHTLKSHFARKH